MNKDMFKYTEERPMYDTVWPHAIYLGSYYHKLDKDDRDLWFIQLDDNYRNASPDYNTYTDEEDKWTVIGKWGENGLYVSGSISANGTFLIDLIEAKKRAIKFGLLKQREVDNEE